MFRVILMTLLVVVSNGAMAEWVKVYTNDTETIYVASVRKEGDIVKTQNLTDYKTLNKSRTKNGIAYLSIIEPVEYDCKKNKMRATSLSLFAKNMGGGKMIFSDSFNEAWISIGTNSADSVSLKFACGMI